MAPTVATIEASNISETTFTLTATGEDETEIAKYEFYINGTLEKTVTTTEGTAIYNVTGKAESTTYTCYVKVYDAAGNFKQSDSITVTKLKHIHTDACYNYINCPGGSCKRTFVLDDGADHYRFDCSVCGEPITCTRCGQKSNGVDSGYYYYYIVGGISESGCFGCNAASDNTEFPIGPYRCDNRKATLICGK